MKLFDVSMPVQKGMSVYKGQEERQPAVEQIRKMAVDGVNESVITMNLHTGTHIDAPRHMLEDGEGMESLDLRQLLGSCRVLDLTDVEVAIGERDLGRFDIREEEFILLKTRNSFSEKLLGDFVYLDASGARYLADRKIRGVGIDSLGIERDQPGHETHRTLMGRGVVILEGLRLKDVEEGEYGLLALPVSIKGADGAPARVVLTRDESLSF